MHIIDRATALALYEKYNNEPSLFRHALAVEATMRRFARHFGEDEEYWGIVGLLHDIDYQQYPQEHLKHAPTMLREAGLDEPFIRAVLSHGWSLCTDVEPLLTMEKVLFTIDELTGLISATALMRPSKSLLDLKLSSVKKKWKAKAFSAAIDRELIAKGADMLGMELDQVIELTIEGMQSVASELGLAGA